MIEPLKQNCATCANYDGDGYCSLPDRARLITGYIEAADSVVCVKFEKAQTPEEAMQQAAKDDENRPVGWKDRR